MSNEFGLVTSPRESEKEKESGLSDHAQATSLIPDLSQGEREQNSSDTQGYEYSVPPGLRTNRFLAISSEHFRVAYPADVDHRDANQVLNTLESARSDFLHRASSASVQAEIPTL